MSSPQSLRKRKTEAVEGSKRTVDAGSGPGASKESKSSSRVGLLDVLAVFSGLLALSCGLSWFITGDSVTWGWSPWYLRAGPLKNWLTGPVVLTDSELAAFDGTDPNKPIYVGLNGTVYDVTASKKTYGPGGSYSFFAGKDAARAFITGCFEEDLTPDLRGVEDMFVPVDAPDAEPLKRGEMKIRREQDLRIARKKVKKGIDGWAKVFRGETGRPYFKVGYIKREPDWQDKLPKRELCEHAVKSRPKRRDAEKES